MFVCGEEFGWVQLLVCLWGRVWLGPYSRLSVGRRSILSFVYGAEFGWVHILVCLWGGDPFYRLSVGRRSILSFVYGAEIHLIVCGAEIHLIVCLWGGDPFYRLSLGRRSILSFVCGAEIHLIVCLWGRIIKQWELISAGKTSHKHDNKHNQKDLSCLR